tara:strand:+ start:237 stop:938 length:702 start_codon:yes stop_codon:yes gene_type:complete
MAVQQRLREMAGVACMLRNREVLRDLLHAGNHAAFAQRAVQFFGAAPAGVDSRAYISELQTAVQTQRSFYERMNAGNVVTVQGMQISGRWDARRAKQRRNFLFLAREGADDSFATAHRQYFDPDLNPGPNGELFDDFAEWTMREHPGWTTLRDIDDHCRQLEKPTVPMIFTFVVVAAFVVFLFPLVSVLVYRVRNPYLACGSFVQYGLCEFSASGLWKQACCCTAAGILLRLC